MPLFVLYWCLSLALWLQTRVHDGKTMFHLVHFSPKIFHIIYFMTGPPIMVSMYVLYVSAARQCQKSIFDVFCLYREIEQFSVNLYMHLSDNLSCNMKKGCVKTHHELLDQFLLVHLMMQNLDESSDSGARVLAGVRRANQG